MTALPTPVPMGESVVPNRAPTPGEVAGVIRFLFGALRDGSGGQMQSSLSDPHYDIVALDARNGGIVQFAKTHLPADYQRAAESAAARQGIHYPIGPGQLAPGVSEYAFAITPVFLDVIAILVRRGALRQGIRGNRPRTTNDSGLNGYSLTISGRRWLASSSAAEDAILSIVKEILGP